MKKILTLLFFAAVSAAAHGQLVVQVIDADTYKILFNGKLQTVRLENVDAPELKQSFGIAAKDSVKAIIERKTVIVSFHGSDLYSRQLASITINGQSLDSILVCRGFAWHYKQYSNKQDLSICEASAKTTSVGLWRCRDPVPPWIWRKLNARNKRLYGTCR